jgi:hypothetical protein
MRMGDFYKQIAKNSQMRIFLADFETVTHLVSKNVNGYTRALGNGLGSDKDTPQPGARV